MDIEAIAKIATDINDGLAWGQDALDTIEMVGHSVLEVPLVEKCVPTLTIVVAPDEAGAETLVELADRLSPAVVLYTEDVTSEGIPVVTFHLGWAGGWADVRCYVADAAPAVTLERRREFLALRESTVKEMLAADEPKTHRALSEVRDEIEKRLAAAGIPANRISALYPDLNKTAEEAFAQLVKQHQAAFRTDAKAYAEKVIEAVATERGPGAVPSDTDVFYCLNNDHPSCILGSEVRAPVIHAVEQLLRERRFGAGQ